MDEGYLSDEALANRILDSGVGVHCGCFFGLTRPLDMARTFVNSWDTAGAMIEKVESVSIEQVGRIWFVKAHKGSKIGQAENASLPRASSEACYHLLHEDNTWRCLACQQIVSECVCKMREQGSK